MAPYRFTMGHTAKIFLIGIIIDISIIIIIALGARKLK